MSKIVCRNETLEKLIAKNDGYCLCTMEYTEDFKCHCKAFREASVGTICHCGVYEKVEESE